MEVIDVRVPVKCFPRFQYMLNRRNDLSGRYNILMRKYKLDNCTLNAVNDDNIRILFCKSVNSKNLFPSIELVVPRYLDTINKRIYISSNFREGLTLTGDKCFILLIGGDTLTYDHLKWLEGLPVTTILLGKDIKETSILSDIIRGLRNIDVCLEENISTVLTKHLERDALTGMRDACDNLNFLLTGKSAGELGVSQTKQKTKGEIIRGSGDIKLIKQRALSVGQGTKDDSNRCSIRLGPAKNKKESLYDAKIGRVSEQSQIPTDIPEADLNVIERLHDEFVGTFNRSVLPEDEKPYFADKLYTIDKTLLYTLQKQSHSIESIGYHCSTLQVNVNCNPISDELKRSVERIMESYSIKKYTIVSSGVRDYLTCHVGKEVKIEYEKGKYFNGTLGGFATTSSGESERTWAILSRHVVKGSFDMKLYIANDEQTYIGKVMKEVKEETVDKQYLDIAAASLESEISFDPRYITEEKVLVPGKRCFYDADSLRGLNVHIKGASTELGLGTITIPEQIAVQNDNLDENHIIVEDRYGGNAFCKEGDSGAIVCAENPDKYGEEVQLISMVIGENMNKKGSYTTVRLDKGLEELKSLTAKKCL
ncbi:uncharacterized protein LOC132737250 isoform X2 [Ruditapes philippinarum]|uniref:uncharacterized protein LOC132737250 isoform X2 n=1 Tax=Ruditapes philippinarum TaxID=129788 RepID=UPI00295B3713|nr:uncharacterized protein LOC132737250 isoform X2 [Ruditapes philippinarum]